MDLNKKAILVVDDERDIRDLLCISLERMGYMPVPAANCEEALTLINRENFELALTDIRLPDGNGLSLISEFKKVQPDSPIAVMTAYDTTDIAVDAMKKGAFDFLPKPIRHQRLKSLVDDALETNIDNQNPEDKDLITGHADSIKNLRKMIIKVAQTQAPVLITGESGTGKELTARSIHQKSHRHNKPFIAVNCGAIPSELMESEFFGHKKGSFTGANSDKQGLFQAAEGGTLFLDEVADLPLNMQVKLLRAIQEKAIRPVGAQEETLVNVRILSATHKGLAHEVSKGNFRQDLFYRLNVIDIKTPALRERKEDIPDLCASILRALGSESVSLSDSALSLLTSYDFPGNVRELENLLHRALALCDDKVISSEYICLPEDKPTENHHSEIRETSSLEIADLEQYLADIERRIILDVLKEENWNRTKTAERLGLTPRQFRYKVSKYGLSTSES